jgi:hypothetical protein
MTPSKHILTAICAALAIVAAIPAAADAKPGGFAPTTA